MPSQRPAAPQRPASYSPELFFKDLNWSRADPENHQNCSKITRTAPKQKFTRTALKMLWNHIFTVFLHLICGPELFFYSWSGSFDVLQALFGEICHVYCLKIRFLYLIWLFWCSTSSIWWDLICLLLKNQIFTSDLASLMLYETSLMRSALFIAQKSDFNIWSGYLRLSILLSGN